jgi:hypothetical protein
MKQEKQKLSQLEQKAKVIDSILSKKLVGGETPNVIAPCVHELVPKPVRPTVTGG